MNRRICFILTFLAVVRFCPGQTTRPFDGRPWNVSTGNLSVSYIQASPIGAFPKADYFEPPPKIEDLSAMNRQGLTADEDYIAWGAVEREPGEWDFRQHDAMEKALHAAGMNYVVYDWLQFPPVWLRDQQKDKRTLMKCLEHDKETNYLSIFDPRTVAWYEHFYKAVHDHFGNRVDDIYACILGPYGEGNYPLYTPDWVKMGHCHEGYWCGDEFAIVAFQSAMREKYGTIEKLNNAWDQDDKSFDEVKMPKEIIDRGKITPKSFQTIHERRRWLDFITWYHQAIIDFAEQSYKALAKYYPNEKIRMKPGGTAGGVNPIAWGTYCPGYAKMAGKHSLTLQPADCQGAVFADKWVSTAYAFYGVRFSAEPASAVDRNTFVQRMFSEASCGASQFFTYEFEQHAADMQKYLRLYTGQRGETRIALYCPTTYYRLGGDLTPTISAATRLRDLCDFDVLDELLISDGALNRKSYGVLIITQAEIVDQPILEKLNQFTNAGGKIILVGQQHIKNVEGEDWTPAQSPTHIAGFEIKSAQWLTDLVPLLKDIPGCDGNLDHLWTTRRGSQFIVYNPTDKPINTRVDGESLTVEGHSIWSNR